MQSHADAESAIVDAGSRALSGVHQDWYNAGHNSAWSYAMEDQVKAGFKQCAPLVAAELGPTSGPIACQSTVLTACTRDDLPQTASSASTLGRLNWGFGYNVSTYWRMVPQ